jgi:alpha/beta superfamily hydrolase
MSTHIIPGPAGDLEIALDMPMGGVVDLPKALALVAHPHPLHGGTMDNKVTTTLARACAAAGCAVVRFNCRGVGLSAGTFDHSHGETDDAAAALAYLQAQYAADLPIVLCGFSFGTAVAAQLAQRLAPERVVAMILAGAAVQRFAATVTVNPEITLMVHGECDETVPLAETMAWATKQSLAISVIPRADHFFNRQLLPLKLLANRHFKALLG